MFKKNNFYYQKMLLLELNISEYKIVNPLIFVDIDFIYYLYSIKMVIVSFTVQSINNSLILDIMKILDIRKDEIYSTTYCQLIRFPKIIDCHCWYIGTINLDKNFCNFTGIILKTSSILELSHSIQDKRILWKLIKNYIINK